MTRRLSLALIAFFVTSLAIAQDVAKVAPKNIKVLLDNAEVRVLEYTAAKGEKIGMHSHPPYVVYALSSGKTHFVTADGKTRDLELKTGDATWSDGGAHTQESLSANHAIVIELKHAKPLGSPAPQGKKK
ncbi:MAG: hypothetical protein NVSMB68_12810 [Thermoanaerobaculia bacterium]